MFGIAIFSHRPPNFRDWIKRCAIPRARMRRSASASAGAFGRGALLCETVKVKLEVFCAIGVSEELLCDDGALQENISVKRVIQVEPVTPVEHVRHVTREFAQEIN